VPKRRCSKKAASASSSSVLVVHDQHALAGGQPVGLEHHRQADRLAASRASPASCDHLEGRRWDVVPLHELLGEHLAALELRACRDGPEDRQAAALELVDEAQRQRQLGPHHHQVDLEVGGEVGQRVDLVGGHRHESAISAIPGLPGAQ
jgi:hypothetical protein